MSPISYLTNLLVSDKIMDFLLCSLAGDYQHVSQQVKQLEEDTAVVLKDVTTAKNTMNRVLSVWDTYSDCLSSLQAWLEQSSATATPGNRAEVIVNVKRKKKVTIEYLFVSINGH